MEASDQYEDRTYLTSFRDLDFLDFFLDRLKAVSKPASYRYQRYAPFGCLSMCANLKQIRYLVLLYFELTLDT